MLVVPTILSSGKGLSLPIIAPPLYTPLNSSTDFTRRSGNKYILSSISCYFLFFPSTILASLLSFDSSTDSKRERGSIVESNFSLQLGKIDLFNAKVCRPLSRGVGVTTTESQMIYKRAKVEQVPLKLVQKLLEIVPYLDAFQKWIPSSSDTRLRTFETFWKRLNRSIFKLWAGTLSRLRERTKWGGVVSAFAQHLHFLSPM